MARSRSRSRRGTRGGSRTGSRDGSSKAEKKDAPKRGADRAAETIEEVEVVEEGRSLGIDDGMVIITTLILIAAFCLTDYLLGIDYAEGVFFKGKFGG